ncbi:MAG: family 20 glycosylhydrolase [Spirochaetales bacterium]|nr:family 20 glycosylhydrolase [Spirochaetales bacterium]
MARNIDTILTPQIKSEGVGYDKLVVLGGRISTSEGCTANHVRITDDGAFVSGISSEDIRLGLGYIRQLEVYFDGKVPVCEFDFYSPARKHRGFMIDVCRHFIPIDELKRIIDLMSMIGYNTFQWHLTEDQGWRFPVDGYPLLQEISQWRDNDEYENEKFQYGGMYSDADMKDIVSFCAERGVTVIPEIDVPGHATALLAAYPIFGCTGRILKVERKWGVFKDVLNPASEELWTFLTAVISKLASIFPGPFIHIGGDECRHEQWENNPSCITLMKEKGLKDCNELQGWFTSRLASIVSSFGKRAMGWDEVVEAPEIDKSVVVLSWRGLDGARIASSRGHNVILCPQQGMYFDKGYTDDTFEPKQWGSYSVKDTFDIDLDMKDLPPKQRSLVLGAQCNVWTERMRSGREVEYMMFPRAFALADNMCLGDKKSWEKALARRTSIHDLCWKMNIVCSPAAWETQSDGYMRCHVI